MNLTDKVKNFQHIYNPLHFYSRLIEAGMSEPKAQQYVREYEEDFYSVIIAELLEKYI